MLLCDLGNFLKSVAITGQAENKDPKYKVKHLWSTQSCSDSYTDF